MRVITGTAKGRKLSTLKGNDIRPTADRVKEGMFSAIQFKLPGAKVLDLFAGSGQLGIEALSRGACVCTFVDSSREAHQIQILNLKATGLNQNSRVVLSDSLLFIKNTTDRYDIIIMDPPYHTNLLLSALISAQNKLTDNGIIICEHEAKLDMPKSLDNITLQKQYKYGKIKLTIYNKFIKS